MKRFPILLLLLYMATPLAAWEKVGPGVDYKNWSRAGVGWHVSRIDLTNEEILVVASQESDRGRTVSQFADTYDAIAVINGDYFDEELRVTGHARGPCGDWNALTPKAPRRQPVVTISDRRAAIVPVESREDPLPESAGHAVAGWPMLVRDCRALSSSELPGSDPFTRAPHARTAVGVSRDGKTMFFVVVEGFREEGKPATGATLPDLAKFMRDELKVCTAVNLDGGGSSAMAVNEKLISTPTYKRERAVANHLAVVRKASYKGCTLAPQTAEIWEELSASVPSVVRREENLWKATYVRSDLPPLRLGEKLLDPNLFAASDLTYWRRGANALMVGELALRPTEVNDVVGALVANGVTVTSIHAGAAGIRPGVVFVDVTGSGLPGELGSAVTSALRKSATPLESRASLSNDSSSEVARFSETLNRVSWKRGGANIHPLALPLDVKMEGVTTPRGFAGFGSIGVQSAGSGSVVVAGRIPARTADVTKVVDGLRSRGFTITAIHNQLLGTDPALTAIHFIAEGNAEELGRKVSEVLAIFDPPS